MNDDPNEEEIALEQHRRALARSRRFWIWMGMIPGLGTWPLLLILHLLLALNHPSKHLSLVIYAAGLLWIVRCVTAIAQTYRYEAPSGVVWMWIAWFFPLLMWNLLLLFGTLLATCTFHPIY